MANKWTEKIIRQWIEEQIELNPGASLEKLRQTEEAVDFLFPAQFNELYLLVNGFKDNDWRVNMFSIWPLDTIVEEYHSKKDKNFVGFSDFLINSHQIGFTKDRSGIFKYYTTPEYIADTFEQALLLINTDLDIIY